MFGKKKPEAKRHECAEKIRNVAASLRALAAYADGENKNKLNALAREADDLVPKESSDVDALFDRFERKAGDMKIALNKSNDEKRIAELMHELELFIELYTAVR